MRFAPARLLRIKGTFPCSHSRWMVGEAVVVAACVVVTAATTAFGQGEEGKFANWSKIESAAEARTYKDAMRGGGAFDAAAKTFLEEIALPQLALEANRGAIERVRKRIREFLLADIANEKSVEDANKSVLAFMQSLAGKEDTEAVTRINAMLLIGELQGMDRKPWPGAAPALAEAIANTELPKAVRIAACVGLARHAESLKGVAEEQQRLAAVAGPAIKVVLQQGVTGDRRDGQKDAASSNAAVEDDWMASRCLSMLTMLGPLTPAMAADVVRILDDAGRTINVRVRAAAALSVSAGAGSKVDAAAAITSIGSVAIAALEQDAATADKLVLDRQFGGSAGGPIPGQSPMMPPGGFGPPGMPFDPTAPGRPAVEQLIPREACRRAAWRLSVLADAILTDDSKRGLARLGSEPPPAAVELSQSLRRAAMELDATPDEQTLRQALAALKPKKKPAAEPAAQPPATPAGRPARPAG